MQRSAVSVPAALYWLLGWVLLGWRSLWGGGRFTVLNPNNRHQLQNTISLLTLLDLSCPYSTCLRKILPIKGTGRQLGESNIGVIKEEGKEMLISFPWLFCRLFCRSPSRSFWAFSCFRRVCCCFLSCRALAEPPLPLEFLPSLRGDSQLFSLIRKLGLKPRPFRTALHFPAIPPMRGDRGGLG